MKLYKVLKDGKSCHGGAMEWSLPKGKRPGKWHEVEGELVLCQNGLHLTDSPAHWWGLGHVAYLVEAQEVKGDPSKDPSRKVVARKVRLIRELTKAELEKLGVFVDGEHEVKHGIAHASGSANVTASGSANVTAYDSAKVTASGSANVTASGSAKVTASGSAKVTASGSANVTAYDSAKVTASGSAKVTAYDSAKVTAYDSANVTAYDSANVTASGSANVTADDRVVVVSWRGSPTIVLASPRAAWVDQRDDAPGFTTGKRV
jgi:hypothetical protein